MAGKYLSQKFLSYMRSKLPAKMVKAMDKDRVWSAYSDREYNHLRKKHGQRAMDETDVPFMSGDDYTPLPGEYDSLQKHPNVPGAYTVRPDRSLGNRFRSYLAGKVRKHVFGMAERSDYPPRKNSNRAHLENNIVDRLTSPESMKRISERLWGPDANPNRGESIDIPHNIMDWKRGHGLQKDFNLIWDAFDRFDYKTNYLELEGFSSKYKRAVGKPHERLLTDSDHDEVIKHTRGRHKPQRRTPMQEAAHRDIYDWNPLAAYPTRKGRAPGEDYRKYSGKPGGPFKAPDEISADAYEVLAGKYGDSAVYDMYEPVFPRQQGTGHETYRKRKRKHK